MINRNFFYLLSGQFVSQIGDKFHYIALSFWVLKTTGSSAKMAAVLAASLIPSVIPQIVNEKDLASANSKHQFVNGFSTIAGAFLGGIFISAFGYLWVFIINAISFIVSAGFECFIHIPPKLECAQKEEQSGILEDMKQGYQYIFSNRVLVILLFMVMIIHFFVGSIEVFMPVIAHTICQDGARTFGFFQAALGLGTIIMAIVLSIKSIFKKEKTALFTSVFCIGLLYVAASFFKGNETVLLSLFLAMIFLFGCCIICAGISFKTLLQKSIDNKFAGRVFAVAGSVGNAAIPGAMIIYGVLLEKYEYQTLLMISGLVLMLLSIISLILYKEEKDGGGRKIVSKPVT